MKNVLDHTGHEQLLLSNVDDGTNTLFINGVEIPSSQWVGSGNYSQVIDGVTITIEKIDDLLGDVMLRHESGTHYIFVKATTGMEGNVILWTSGGALIWG